MYYIVWSDWDTSECEEHPNKRSAEERLNKLLCDPNNNGKNDNYNGFILVSVIKGKKIKHKSVEVVTKVTLDE